MSGIYLHFGQLRETALRLALDKSCDEPTDTTIARAEAYFQFLVGDVVDD